MLVLLAARVTVDGGTRDPPRLGLGSILRGVGPVAAAPSDEGGLASGRGGGGMEDSTLAACTKIPQFSEQPKYCTLLQEQHHQAGRAYWEDLPYPCTEPLFLPLPSYWPVSCIPAHVPGLNSTSPIYRSTPSMPSARTLSPTSGCTGGAARCTLDALGVFVRVEVLRKPPASLGRATRPGVANCDVDAAGVLALDKEADACV